MSFTVLLAAVLLAILLSGIVVSVFAPKRATDPPTSGSALPPLVVGVCTLPLAAFAFYMALGYSMLNEIFTPYIVNAIFIVLQVALPLVAGGICVAYYLKSGFKIRYYLLFWLNLVLAAIGTGAWGIGNM